MPRSSLLALALCLGGLPLHAAAPPPGAPPIRSTLDVRYHPGRGRQVLDVFAPAARPGRVDGYPVVLFIHGGTWMAGDKDYRGHYRGVGRQLARSGHVAVVINYRLSPQVRHPGHVEDCARAFAWTVKNIARYGGDPTRIIVAGHSAGGHLATLMVADRKYLDDPALDLDASARRAIRGVVSISGVYRVPEAAEFHAMAAVFVNRVAGVEGQRGVAALMRPALFAVGGAVNPFRVVFGTDPDVRKSASPIHHVRAGLPPMLLLNAEREVPGLRQMTDDFAAALRQSGNAVEVKEIEGCTHRSIIKMLHHADTDASRAVLKFITRRVAVPVGKT